MTAGMRRVGSRADEARAIASKTTTPHDTTAPAITAVSYSSEDSSIASMMIEARTMRQQSAISSEEERKHASVTASNAQCNASNSGADRMTDQCKATLADAAP